LLKKDGMLVFNILEAAEKVIKFSGGFNDYREMSDDAVSFDAILMNFIVIGEMASKLSDEFRQTVHNIEWRKIIAFRNIIAHEYFGIDPEEVWEIIHTKVPDLIEELKKVSDRSDRPE